MSLPLESNRQTDAQTETKYHNPPAHVCRGLITVTADNIPDWVGTESGPAGTKLGPAGECEGVIEDPAGLGAMRVSCI